MFTFPNPVNDYAARTVATGVVLSTLWLQRRGRRLAREARVALDREATV